MINQSKQIQIFYFWKSHPKMCLRYWQAGCPTFIISLLPTLKLNSKCCLTWKTLKTKRKMNLTILLKKGKTVQSSNKHCSCISQSEKLSFDMSGWWWIKIKLMSKRMDKQVKTLKVILSKGRVPIPPNKSADKVRLQSEDWVNKCNQCTMQLSPCKSGN